MNGASGAAFGERLDDSVVQRLPILAFRATVGNRPAVRFVEFVPDEFICRAAEIVGEARCHATSIAAVLSGTAVATGR